MTFHFRGPNLADFCPASNADFSGRFVTLGEYLVPDLRARPATQRANREWAVQFTIGEAHSSLTPGDHQGNFF
jgi:hypothetical protein